MACSKLSPELNLGIKWLRYKRFKNRYRSTNFSYKTDFVNSSYNVVYNIMNRQKIKTTIYTGTNKYSLYETEVKL
jgi:hypothetical protein